MMVFLIENKEGVGKCHMRIDTEYSRK